MKLPNAERAVVPKTKITRYLLDPFGKGRDKAEFFTANGFSLAGWETLRDALLRHAAAYEAVEEVLTETGTIYIIEGHIISPTASSLFIRSVWQIDFGADHPRLITAHALAERRRKWRR